jgi:dTDP-4-dehydrorhamnose 3,5-epimerase
MGSESFRVEACSIPDVKMIWLRQFHDSRGFFSELFHATSLATAGVDPAFVQDNYSRSRVPGTVRGLHFQCPPFAQAKLVMAIHGAIFDVAVDLRRDSPTYGQHVAAVLSSSSWNQLYVPAGFAHGFCSLEPNTDVIYKVTAPYSPAHERGLLWNDPALKIGWPAVAKSASLSERDWAYPLLADLPTFFRM